MDILPYEIYILIFSFLLPLKYCNLYDIIVCRIVCKKWKRIVDDIEIKNRYLNNILGGYNKLIYEVMLQLSKNGEFESKWIAYVHSLLMRNGFAYVLLLNVDQLNIEKQKIGDEFKNRVRLQFVQEWQSSIDNSRKCTLYKHIKNDFRFENYLCTISWKYFKYIL